METRELTMQAENRSGSNDLRVALRREPDRLLHYAEVNALAALLAWRQAQPPGTSGPLFAAARQYELAIRAAEAAAHPEQVEA